MITAKWLRVCLFGSDLDATMNLPCFRRHTNTNTRGCVTINTSWKNSSLFFFLSSKQLFILVEALSSLCRRWRAGVPAHRVDNPANKKQHAHLVHIFRQPNFHLHRGKNNCFVPVIGRRQSRSRVFNALARCRRAPAATALNKHASPSRIASVSERRVKAFQTHSANWF